MLIYKKEFEEAINEVSIRKGCNTEMCNCLGICDYVIGTIKKDILKKYLEDIQSTKEFLIKNILFTPDIIENIKNCINSEKINLNNEFILSEDIDYNVYNQLIKTHNFIRDQILYISSKENVLSYLQDNNLTYRIIQEDGINYSILVDVSINRINLYIQNNKIVDVTFG